MGLHTRTRLPLGEWATFVVAILCLVAGILCAAGCEEEVSVAEREAVEEEEDLVAVSESYSTQPEWSEGTIINLDSETVPGQLQLPEAGEVESYPEMWIANAGEDSLSKWSTETNRELARYHTWFGPLANHGAWSGPAPSRTAVDVQGNCYVANRHFDGRSPVVFKILREDYIDRNGNGVMDTSSDANDDGAISPSEMLPMTDLDGDGRIDDDEIVDERIAWAVTVGAANGLGRSLAIDLAGDIWLGLYNSQQYYKLSGIDGSVLEGPINVAPNRPYGALVDSQGILWGASLGTSLLRLDTNTLDVDVFFHSGSDYGIAIAFDDQGCTRVIKANRGSRVYTEYNSCTQTFSTPAAVSYSPLGIATDLGGNVLAPNPGTGSLSKLDPDGNVVWTEAAQHPGEPRGCVVDSNEDVWVILRDTERLAKYDGTDGTPLGVFLTGRQPYTYSDATGLGLFSAVANQGSWTATVDGRLPMTMWGIVSWDSSEPPGTSINVRARSSSDQVNWSTWETAGNGDSLTATPMGRYLQVQAVLRRTDPDATPILFNLSASSLPTALP
jgi:streptogramin lyase